MEKEEDASLSSWQYYPIFPKIMLDDKNMHKVDIFVNQVIYEEQMYVTFRTSNFYMIIIIWECVPLYEFW